MDYQIVHHLERQCFVLTLAGSDAEAVLEYRQQGLEIDFYRTYLPFSLRGKGLAEPLVAAGLKWARAEQLQLTASCWYVEKLL